MTRGTAHVRFCAMCVIASMRSCAVSGRRNNRDLARAQMNKYWMVGLGGFLGAIARFWLGGYISNRMGARFPYGTFRHQYYGIVPDRTWS